MVTVKKTLSSFKKQLILIFLWLIVARIKLAMFKCSYDLEKPLTQHQLSQEAYPKLDFQGPNIKRLIQVRKDT